MLYPTHNKRTLISNLTIISPIITRSPTNPKILLDLSHIKIPAYSVRNRNRTRLWTLKTLYISGFSSYNSLWLKLSITISHRPKIRLSCLKNSRKNKFDSNTNDSRLKIIWNKYSLTRRTNIRNSVKLSLRRTTIKSAKTINKKIRISWYFSSVVGERKRLSPRLQCITRRITHDLIRKRLRYGLLSYILGNSFDSIAFRLPRTITCFWH